MNKKNTRSPHLELTKMYWLQCLSSGDVAVDATCGNGHDTLFLAKLPLSALFSIDIQQTAIENTQSLLQANLSHEELGRIHLRCLSHENWELVSFPQPPQLFIYNLGYLPRGDKTLTTQTATTLSSIKKALTLVKEGGSISITCYPGHDEGEKEERALFLFAQSLPAKQWQVCHHRWINHAVRSPTLLWITRLFNSQ